MNLEEARQVLLLYRPGVTDADVPELTAALELARQDPSLREWFEAHCAFQKKVGNSFNAIAAPEGLREQILSENPARARAGWRRPMLVSALAVCFILAVATITANLLIHRDATGYLAFRQQMVAYTTEGYGMNLATNDLNAIRSYLADSKAPADYTLPGKLDKLDVLGCMTTQWQTHPVSLICLHAAAKSPGGKGNDVWLFFADRQVAHDAPTSTSPQYADVGETGTASWSVNGQTYLLVAQGGQPEVRELLGSEIN